MTFNSNLGMLGLVAMVMTASGLGEGETGSFREPLYYSELDRDQRTPQAVRVGGVVFVSAMSASGESLEVQLRTVYMRLQSVLGNYGLRMADVAQERIYLKTGESYAAVHAARRLVYGEGAAAAISMVEVAGFEDSSTLVEVELMAVANPEVE